MFKILIIDDDPILQLVLKTTLQKQGYDVTVASNGEEGIIQAQQIRPALIICDWMMPHLNGLEVCCRIKANPELLTTFFILLTNREDVEDRVKGLDAGADEFLSKSFEINELKARVRAGLRLYQLNQDLQTRSAALEAELASGLRLQQLNRDLHYQKQALETLNQKLQTQKQILEAELTEAANYVRSLLPSPLLGTVTIETLFVPSVQLGGDCFDYYWLDDENLAIYLLDVSGHGVGAALLSVSVLNVLRSQSLPNTNFRQPNQVLRALNHSFQMVNHGERYFTIWYGVYNQITRQLIYASAGHPPAVLLSGSSAVGIQVKHLGNSGLPLGVLRERDFTECCCQIEASSTLYVFSDGAYEVQQPDSTIWGLEALTDLLANLFKTNAYNLDTVLHQIRTFTSKDNFEDDLSLLKVNFS